MLQDQVLRLEKQLKEGQPVDKKVVLEPIKNELFALSASQQKNVQQSMELLFHFASLVESEREQIRKLGSEH
jgi:hypothetical protein